GPEPAAPGPAWLRHHRQEGCVPCRPPPKLAPRPAHESRAATSPPKPSTKWARHVGWHVEKPAPVGFRPSAVRFLAVCDDGWVRARPGWAHPRGGPGATRAAGGQWTRAKPRKAIGIGFGPHATALPSECGDMRGHEMLRT